MDNNDKNTTNYLVVLGDVDNYHLDGMEERMRKLGVVRQILDNVYVLSAENDKLEEMSMESVRTAISGKDIGYCIVIEMTSLHCAWSLTKQNSDFFKTFFTHD